ncbi:nucleotide-binding oligomerization domain-containing protein 1-like isoform X1 [Bufo bufo]|uniref:nucleotide-binding oligomerization domain-containing protein 1-like isoform X1 n=1 Tax=Bufo bufo TaxID=8384 RepID=UPI001ABDDCBF|nr:nucleotide-binding oligomerization domain-containing protein 1-like isoform X1 [Bufo bufo]XP_040289390.1 nucleotide-binding oligomerization domain-containing protein 1-like isoform X1 [Bufo bufo]XP_040289391.1 nucleotide-binding oligomerization domain-containing protein 1-like isoform X1 [Bufo bufo]XP_040289392.1 nucleotide-binding oligomerization domain-containing protein 1-like isoform X1 [Bufo bufo]
MELQQPGQQSYVWLITTNRETLVNLIRNTECLLENLVDHGYCSTEESEIVQNYSTTADKVRQIIDLVQCKGEEVAEFFIHILNKVPEAYYDLNSWLTGINFQPSEQIKNLQVTNNDPVTLYSKKLKQELCCDSNFVKSYSQREEMKLQETYVNSVMELVNDKNETMGRINDVNSLFDDTGVINVEGGTIFIYGDAGMGKTLLIQKMQNMWAKGESFSDVKFLFSFSCRRFIIFDANTQLSLKDLLFRYNCHPDHYPEEVFHYILRFPETVMFTFDGFDEMHSNFDLNNVPEVSLPTDTAHPAALFMHLLSGKLLKGSRKVLTARTGCQVPKKFVRKRIMLRGFGTENLKEYTNLFFREPSVQMHVLNHLEANHNISSLCSIPLFCWIIFKCYEHFHSINESHTFSSSSVTLTDIFLLIIEVYLNSSNSGTTRSQVDTYKKGRETLQLIGKLAYSGMDNSAFVFDYDTITSLNISEQYLKLGFLRTVKNYDGCGGNSSFEFFHVTLQSFFTALFLVIDREADTTELLKYFGHWAQSPQQELQLNLMMCFCAKNDNQIDSFSNIDHLQFINLFLCGLLSKPKQVLLEHLVPPSVLKVKRKALKQQLFRSVKFHLKHLPRSRYLEYNRVHALTHFIWMARCVCETQCEKVGKKVAKGICADYIQLSFCGASSSDCGAISFLLNLYKKEIALELDNNNINDYGVKELIPCFRKLTVVRLSVNQITDEGVKVLAEEVTKYRIIKFLGLYKNRITDFGAKYVAQIIRECPLLHHVMLGYNKFTGVGGRQIAEALQTSTHIYEVGMWGNHIGDEGAQAFAETIRNHPCLEILSLACNGITSVGGRCIADALQHNTSIKTLWLTENNITDEATESFAEMLKVNKTLKTLWLNNNHITNMGANIMAEALDHNTVLEDLSLHKNPLTLDEKEPFHMTSRIRT